jgi:hypothetical protein
MKTVFIDSQIWLSLYDFSSDDLTQFSKLHDLVGRDIEIVLTEQVFEEVKRNRENKIRDALSAFRNVGTQIPNLCKGYEQYSAFRELQKHYQAAHKDLLKLVEADIDKEALHADQVIERIFSKLVPIRRTNELVQSAKIRYEIGNPPGKDKSYGDAINWLTLMECVPNGVDLFFVSGDKDYRSAVNDDRMNGYLRNEWKDKKSSDIFLYKSLTDFFNLHLKDIELKTEDTRNQLICALGNSGSFAQTHSIIATLEGYATWNEDQTTSVLTAAEKTNQVWGIIDDPDLKAFFSRVLKDHIASIIGNETLRWILRRMGHAIPESPDLERAPF